MPKYCSDCGKKVCENCAYCPKCKKVAGKGEGILRKVDKLLGG